MRGGGWLFRFDRHAELPPLAWVATIAGGTVAVNCGLSVRCADDGFFEGTWVGEARLGAVVESTSVFGSGIVNAAGGLFVVPPSHTLEGLYVWRGEGEVVISNSLVGLLEASGHALDPDVAYPPLFVASVDGPARPLLKMPLLAGELTIAHYENLRVHGDDLEVERRPRERPFSSFDDYVVRINAALASAIANAPGYTPVVAASSGFDSIAVAAIARGHGARRMVTIASGKEVGRTEIADDSGESAGRALGLEVELFPRLGYMASEHVPEAEFLATGMSGEEVVMAEMERALRRSLLLTGHYGGLMWRKGKPASRDLWRGDMSGTSLTEFRLRVDCIHVPLPVFGRTEQPSLMPIARAAEMRPFSIGGGYDKPVARRLSEEAGVPRDAFGIRKRSASGTLHSDGPSALAPQTRASLERFAASEGRPIAFRRRRRIRRRERFLIKLAEAGRVGRLVEPLKERRYSLTHFEPEFGTLLLRWAVEVIRTRYRAVARRRAASTTSARPPS